MQFAPDGLTDFRRSSPPLALPTTLASAGLSPPPRHKSQRRMGAVRGSVQRRPSARHRRHVGLAAGGAIDASAACRTRARRTCLPRMPRCTSGPRADAEARPLGRRNTTTKHREEASRFLHFPACFHERTRAFFQRPGVKAGTRARCCDIRPERFVGFFLGLFGVRFTSTGQPVAFLISWA